MFNNERGLATIIATALLVLLTVAAAAIVLRFAVPFVRNTLNEGSECFNYKDYFTFEEKFELNCYVADLSAQPYNPNFYINIKAKTTKQEIEEKVTGFKLLFKKNDVLKVIEVIGGQPSVDGDGSIRMYNNAEAYLSIPNGGESRSYVYNHEPINLIYEKLEIYPILKSGKLCEMSDSTEINIRCGLGV